MLKASLSVLLHPLPDPTKDLLIFQMVQNLWELCESWCRLKLLMAALLHQLPDSEALLFFQMGYLSELLERLCMLKLPKVVLLNPFLDSEELLILLVVWTQWKMLEPMHSLHDSEDMMICQMVWNL